MHSTRDVLQAWVIEALEELGGQAPNVVRVCKVVWRRHENDLRQSGDLFYSWQYDIRWAAQKLRNQGILRAADKKNVPWELA